MFRDEPKRWGSLPTMKLIPNERQPFNNRPPSKWRITPSMGAMKEKNVG